MKNYLPEQNKNYLQTNRSDDKGSLWSTMGLDFQSNFNTMRVAPRLKVNTSTADDAQLGLPVAFSNFDFTFFAICGGSVFKNGSTVGAAFTEDASTGAVTTYDSGSDLTVFDARLWSTAAAKLYSKVTNGTGGGTWTERATFSGNFHPLVNFTKFNRLYYPGSAEAVYSIDTANVAASSGDYTLTLGAGAVITCMKATSTSIWIGVSSLINSPGSPPAYILEWDGISAQATNKYLLKSPYICSIVIDRNIPYVMDGNGVLNKYTGYSFDEISRLPFTTTPPHSGFIHRNGLVTTKNNTILALVNNYCGTDPAVLSVATTYENLSAGVWEYSDTFGFTHRYSFTYNPSDNSTITDYGQSRIYAPGAIFQAKDEGQTISNGSLLLGATYYTSATVTTSSIFFDDSNNTVQKKGYFVTTWFNSNEIEDKWTRLWVTYRRLLASTDSLVFKYRIQEEDPIYATITWVNTTSFTTTTDITAYGPTATGFNGTIGGEVEVLQGTGSGACIHITNIVNNAGTYTVTIDDAVTGVTTGTAKARFQKWIKLLPEITGQVKSWEQMAIAVNNVRIQVKGCLTFTGDGEFFKFALFSNEDIKINA